MNMIVTKRGRLVNKLFVSTVIPAKAGIQSKSIIVSEIFRYNSHMPMLSERPTDASGYCMLYVVRHGETEWNVKRLLQGQTDSPLTSQGEEQARALGKRLKDVHFDAAFSSDLLRARRTAEFITLEKAMAVETTKILRERSFGKYEGKPYDSYYTELKHMFERFEQLADDERAPFKFADDVESDAEIVARFNTFLRETAVAYPGKTVLAVSHGGMMRSLVYHLGIASYTGHQVHVKNTAYIKLLSDGIDYFVEELFNIDIVPNEPEQ